MKSLKFNFIFMLLIFITSINAQYTTISSWDFESGTTNPTVGQGSLTFTGGVGIADWFKTGISEGVSIPMGIDEKLITTFGKGLQTTNYPAQGTNPNTAGIRIDLNTTGYKNLVLNFDVRHGGTSANKIVLKYTADGGVNWNKVATYTHDKDDMWYLCNFNFQNFPDAFDNPKFGINLVTNFDTLEYVPVKLTTPYDPSGPIRYDNIKFRGQLLSEIEESRTSLVNWNFENGNLNPSTGSGTLSFTGGLAVLWTKTGIVPGSTIIDQGVYEIGKIEEGIGMQTLNYPVQGTNSKKAGIQINTSTAGYKNILFEADVRYGGTSANLFFLQYTADGTNWIDATSFSSNSGDTWYLRRYDFSAINAVNNNSKFGLRYVSALNPSLYIATGVLDSKVYSTTGPVRFDNISIKADYLTAGVDELEVNYKILTDKIIFNQNIKSIQIYNLQGIVVIKANNTSQININQLVKGIYFCMYDDQKIKFVK